MKGAITVYCDCSKALKNVLKPNFHSLIDYLVYDNNLIQESKYLLKITPIKISLQWVKGHPTGENEQPAHKLNKIAHDLAYNFLKQPHPSFKPSICDHSPVRGSHLRIR